MATFAARRLLEMAANTRGIVAIELLAAAQGVDFHAPLRSSQVLQRVRDAVRERVPFYQEDRYFAPDIAAAIDYLHQESLTPLLAELLPSWG